MTLARTAGLLEAARGGGYGVGAFNVYDLLGARAVAAAAEAERSPVIMQVHPAAWRFGGWPLLALTRAVAEEASVPIAVHFDHAESLSDIAAALAAGIDSIMPDGSKLDFAANVNFVRSAVAMASGAFVEAELGRLAGSEDGAAELDGRLTDSAEAAEFVACTRTDALAVCVGNVHGRTEAPVMLDFERLAKICDAVPVPLVLHGASGLPAEDIWKAISLGVCKFNVNTELREAYLEAIAERDVGDLLDVLGSATSRMTEVARAKLRVFGSGGRA